MAETCLTLSRSISKYSDVLSLFALHQAPLLLFNLPCSGSQPGENVWLLIWKSFILLLSIPRASEQPKRINEEESIFHFIGDVRIEIVKTSVNQIPVCLKLSDFLGWLFFFAFLCFGIIRALYTSHLSNKNAASWIYFGGISKGAKRNFHLLPHTYILEF